MGTPGLPFTSTDHSPDKKYVMTDSTVNQYPPHPHPRKRYKNGGGGIGQSPVKRPQTEGGKYVNNGKCHCREEIKRNLWEDDLDELDQPKKCKMGINCLLDGCICEERKSQRTKQKAGGRSGRYKKSSWVVN